MRLTLLRVGLAIVLLSNGCSKFAVLNAMVPSGAIVARDLRYGEGPHRTLDLYRPIEATKPHAALPIVIFFYGGYWRAGEASNYRFVAQALTSNGFIAVLPNTRLYPDGIFPTFVEDGAAAVRWTRDHAVEIGGDPDQLFLMGHSSGAHVAALLALDRSYLASVGVPPEAIRGAALLSGPYDFVVGAEDRVVFGLADGDPRSQPIHFVRADAPPLLLLHGLQDTVVNPDNTPKLAAAMKAVGGDATTITYARRGHVGVVLALAYPFRWLAPVTRDVTTFFHSHLRQPTTRESQ